MAGRMQNLSSLFSNMRTRTILFATGGILILVVIVGFFGFRSTTQQVKDSASVKTTSNIQSVPGLTAATPEYANVQSKLNEKNYNEAVKSQGSAIPTVIGRNKNGKQANAGSFPGDKSTSTTNAANNTNNTGTSSTSVGSGTQQTSGAAADDKSLNSTSKGEMAQMLKQQKQQMAALQKQLQQAQSQEAQQQQQQLSQAMQSQAQQLMASWSGSGAVSAQAYVEGEVAKTQKSATANSAGGAAGTNTAASDSNQQNSSGPVIKAGDILFAILSTSVNSDEPGPVMATVVQGSYKGAKLIGSIQKTAALPGTNGPTRVVLNFTTMSIPHSQNSLSISAVAIDPDTARTALASDVDHHYLERYGSLFASAFLEGYGSAIQQAGSTVTNSVFGGSTQSYGSLSGIEEVAAGLGQVGQEWGSQLGDVLDRPNTITVNSGVGLGILFLSDASLDQTTAPQAPNTTTTNNTEGTQTSAQNTQGVAQASTTVVQ